MLTCPVGRPPNYVPRCYASFGYQAGSWNKKRRVVAKVVRHGRYVSFRLAAVAVPRDLFQKFLSLIDDLRRSPVPVSAEGINGDMKMTGERCSDDGKIGQTGF